MIKHTIISHINVISIMKRTTRPHSLESPEYRANVHTIQPYIFYVGISDKQYVRFAVCNAVSYVRPYYVGVWFPCVVGQWGKIQVKHRM